MSLIESLDEALKALSQDQIMSKTLGGSYSDQKICQGCPHRYTTDHIKYLIKFITCIHSNILLYYNSGILKKNLLVSSVWI